MLRDRRLISRSRIGIAALLLVAAFGSPTIGGPAHAADMIEEPPPEAIPLPKPFRFSTSLRYWYSWGRTKYGFTSRDANYGDPTSTLEWKDKSHSGEIFAKLDHEPSGMFLRGSVGLGATASGTLTDRDFLVGQIRFSDTASVINGNAFRYGMADVGVEFMPESRVKIGPFVGYRYWKDDPLAMGARGNADDVGNVVCPLGSYVVGSAAKAIGYDTTWQAARLGLSGGLSVRLRPDLHGRGRVGALRAPFECGQPLPARRPRAPAEHRLDRPRHGRGGAILHQLRAHAELRDRLRRALLGLFAGNGSSRFKAFAGATYPVTEFDLQRFGLLAQAKYRF